MKSKIRRLGPVVLLAGLGVVASGCGAGLTGPSLTGGDLDITPAEFTGFRSDLGLLGGTITGPTFDPGAVKVDFPTVNTGGIWYGLR